MYVATINTPGYLPDADEPATFDTAAEAWAYLADEVKRAEDDFEGDGYSATANTLESLGNGTLHPNDAGLDFDGTGTVYGPTPGYEGDHDLGKAYSVTEVQEFARITLLVPLTDDWRRPDKTDWQDLCDHSQPIKVLSCDYGTSEDFS